MMFIFLNLFMITSGVLSTKWQLELSVPRRKGNRGTCASGPDMLVLPVPVSVSVSDMVKYSSIYIYDQCLYNFNVQYVMSESVR